MWLNHEQNTYWDDIIFVQAVIYGWKGNCEVACLSLYLGNAHKGPARLVCRVNLFCEILNMNRHGEMWREYPDKLNPRFNTHLATGLVAIGFTGIVLGELSPISFQQWPNWSLWISVNTVFFNSTPEFLRSTGFKTLMPGGSKSCSDSVQSEVVRELIKDLLNKETERIVA